MKRGIVVLVGLGALLLIAGMWLMGAYNGLVTRNEQVDAGWAQVQNVLQRRADLIPNLVETVKGYAAHEREVFEKVAEARGRLAGAVTPGEASAANAGLSSALGRLLAIAENYPQLKANENFVRLQDELAGTENRIATERMRYNELVRDFNTAIKRVPTVIIARVCGFTEREYFEAAPESRTPPPVKF